MLPQYQVIVPVDPEPLFGIEAQNTEYNLAGERFSIFIQVHNLRIGQFVVGSVLEFGFVLCSPHIGLCTLNSLLVGGNQEH